MTVRVLIADDHPIARHGVRQILEGEMDFDVVGEAADGEEALRLACNLRPDILLLDISMPRLNGVEVVKALRRALPQIRIVVITGYEENDRYNEALITLGVMGYLSKRAPPLELLSALRRIQGGQRHFQGAYGELSSRSTSLNQLTGRELQVLRLATRGHSNQEIADQLYTSEATIRFHVHNLFSKLDVKRRSQLSDAARHRGLL